jgi:hypothetical protein
MSSGIDIDAVHTPPALRGLHRDSLAMRLLGFYTINPDEELTFDDIAEKFGVRSNAVSEAVARLRERGLLEYVRVIRLTPKAKGNASGWGSPGPGRNGGPGGCDPEVSAP